ncbi:hypothetical protein [Shouchella miscanthi]|uniref:hypothetical protein n=1 Tax=Shouchella miscanthi TaxID=2598861 RepID=UPI00119D227C|nr:hypothetical protein [Shouchella miscanthi]
MRKVPEELTHQEKADQAMEMAKAMGANPPWNSLALQNNYRNLDGHTLKVAKFNPNVIRFQGAVRSGLLSANTVITVLPQGFRPITPKMLVVGLDGLTGGLLGLVSGSAILDISTDGQVRLRNALVASNLIFYGVTLDLT